MIIPTKNALWLVDQTLPNYFYKTIDENPLIYIRKISSRVPYRSGTVSYMQKGKFRAISPILILVISLSVIFKWHVSQGSAVNSSLLDDENQWQSDISGRSGSQYLLLRDLPGYFVIPMRLVLLVIHQIGLSPAFSVRLFVTATQIFCFWIIAHVLFKSNGRIKYLIFITLTLIPLEDLNYLHNVGYLFALVMIAAWIQSSKMQKRNQIGIAIVCGFLIVKPLVALVLLVSILIDVAIFRKHRDKVKINSFETIFCLISAAYLLTYFLLPNQFNSPESMSLVNLGKATFNFSWILSSTLLPILNFGLIGFLRLEFGRDIANFGGAIIWSLTTLTVCAYLYKQRASVLKFRKRLFRDQTYATLRKLLLVSLITYFSVYTVTNFAWVTIWPLWELAYSPRLWMRWASNVPILFSIVTVSLLLQKEKTRMASCLIFSLIVQYSLLWIFARDVFIRWQGL
jgi:hypothetical protein